MENEFYDSQLAAIMNQQYAGQILENNVNSRFFDDANKICINMNVSMFDNIIDYLEDLRWIWNRSFIGRKRIYELDKIIETIKSHPVG
ncbi:MAG: hypothetical protein FWE01_02945 [Firmicutes bacterium]|nr:hypothetical protein [Bacillota bacterium]